MSGLIETLYDLVGRHLGLTITGFEKILWTFVVIISLIALRRCVVFIVSRRLVQPDGLYIAIKTVNYLVGLTAVLVLLRIWLGGISGLAASLGIISAGLAIALHQPLTNLAGWVFLTVRRPFSVGDRIQIGDHAGDVIDQRLFAFSLVEIGNWVAADQSTGRILHIPNGKVFQETVANYTQGFNFIWNEIPVTVTFESDWQKAKDVLSEIALRHAALKSEDAAREVRKAASTYLIRYEHLTPIVWTSVIDIGVTLTIRYLTNPRRRRSSEHAIWEDVLQAFALMQDVDFAYPTQRFYNNVTEGKPGRQSNGGDARKAEGDTTAQAHNGD